MSWNGFTPEQVRAMRDRPESVAWKLLELPKGTAPPASTVRLVKALGVQFAKAPEGSEPSIAVSKSGKPSIFWSDS